MMRILCVAVGVLFCFGDVSANSAAARYNEGNALYRAGKFSDAIAAYEAVIAQGINRGEVYYNLGNAHFKNGDLGRAILSFERALKLMPEDEDILTNLRFANALKTDRDPELDTNALTRFTKAVLDFFGMNTLAVLCSISLFCIGAILCFWLFMPQRKMIWVGALVVWLLVGGACGGMLAFKVQQQNVQEAIILADALAGRSGPGDDFLEVFVLHEGTKVIVERAEKNWLLVHLANGIGGWVPAEALGRI